MRFVVVCLLLLTPEVLLAEASKEEIPTVSELTEGILAFNCYEKADDFFPIILTEDTNGWTAIGIPDLDMIREVDNGFAFKSSAEDLVLAFLKDEGKNWQLEYFDEDGLNAAKCLEADEFAETIIEVIAPKIFDNATSLSSQLKLTQQELAEKVARGKKREAELSELLLANTNQHEEMQISLMRRLGELRLDYKSLWTAANEKAPELAAFLLEEIISANLEQRSKLISSSNFSSLQDSGYHQKLCYRALSWKPQNFTDVCKEISIKHWLKP